MKKIVAISLFLIFNILCFAQSSIRATGGVGFTFWNFDATADNKTLIGGAGEFVYNYKFKSKFFVETGIHINRKGFKLLIDVGESGYSNIFLLAQRHNYIGVPFRIGYDLISKNNLKFNFYLGGYYELMFSGKDRIDDGIYNFQQRITFKDEQFDYLRRNQIGLLTGVGLDYSINKFILFARYEYQQGFMPVIRTIGQESIDAGVYNKRPRNSTIFLRLGVGINLSKNKDL